MAHIVDHFSIRFVDQFSIDKYIQERQITRRSKNYLEKRILITEYIKESRKALFFVVELVVENQSIEKQIVIFYHLGVSE